MLPDPLMRTLHATYKQIARPWTHEELAKRLNEVRRYAEQAAPSDHDDQAQSPVAILASAVPALAALDVAIHAIHALPDAVDQGLLEHLWLSAGKNAAAALQRSHLELDGSARGYTPEEWLPAVYKIADRLLRSARLDHEPPSLVEEATAAVRWRSRAIIDLDQDAPDTTAALVDGLGRLLALGVFAAVGHDVVDA